MKHVKDSTPEEQAATLRELIRGAKPPPPPSDDQPKLAKDMTPAEQAAFLADHRKKFA